MQLKGINEGVLIILVAIAGIFIIHSLPKQSKTDELYNKYLNQNVQLTRQLEIIRLEQKNKELLKQIDEELAKREVNP